MRVALSEGFGNAFAGMVLGDPIYRDSLGTRQSSDFHIDLESNESVNRGWYSEGSVQTILYDIFDADADANDSLNLGFSAIYNAMTDPDYVSQSSLTSIFSLLTKIQDNHPGSLSAIDALVTSQNIDAVADNYGSGESNNGGNADSLPVYKTLTDDGSIVTVCSNNVNGEYNRLGNRQFIVLTVASSGSHRITVIRIPDPTPIPSDPDVLVCLDGSVQAAGESIVSDSEVLRVNLEADEYILEVYDYNNIDLDGMTSANVCFSVSVI